MAKRPTTTKTPDPLDTLGVPIPADQLGLEFADEGKPSKAPSEIRSDPPAHPADDSDLAGQDDGFPAIPVDRAGTG